MHSRRADHHVASRRTRRALFGSFSALTAAVVLASCGADSGAGSPGGSTDPAALVGKTYVTGDRASRSIPGGGPFVLSFPEQGRLTANAGCNGHGGPVDFDGSSLSVGDLAATMMGCPPPRDGADKWVTDLLSGPVTWSLEGRTLTLHRDRTEVVLSERVDRPVAGTTWLVTGLLRNNGLERSVALDDAKPTLTIGADATVRGWTGCNDLRGEASVVDRDGDRIVQFGRLATTRKACTSPERADIEHAMLAALEGDVVATVDGDDLSLTNAADPSIGLRLTVAPAKNPG